MMADMNWNADDFSEYFRSVYEYEPFLWQWELAHQVLTQGWPDVLALPTAAGKTAVLDIALFALAAQADLPPYARKAPRRIVFVVDRCVVVNATFTRARRLRQTLETAQDGILRQMRDALLRLGGECPLQVTELRGGIWHDEAWARTPLQPAIIVSTVDQIGSRLLFRGYGLSPNACPMHAALLANDSLIIIDEAHLSTPFVETLSRIRQYRGWAEESLQLPFSVVTMSATPAQTTDLSVFPAKEQRLLEDDAILQKRLVRPKYAELLTLPKKDFEKIIAEKARESTQKPGTVTAVIVNRVATARSLFQTLKDEFNKDKAKGQTPELILLTGRSRRWERDLLLQRYADRLLSVRKVDTTRPPLLVIATQCVEAGADFDFDQLITEACPLDSLRQRLGRLNRTGARDQASVCIIAKEEELAPKDKDKDKGKGKDKDKDPIYGNAACETFKWLQSLKKEWANSQDVLFANFKLDLSTYAMENALANTPPASLSDLLAPVRHAPVLFPVYCDIWEQTSPLAEPSPAPAPFLHGVGVGPADVQIIWRADLLENNLEDWSSCIAMFPPMAGETLTVRLEQARTWLTEDTDSKAKSLDKCQDDDTEQALPCDMDNKVQHVHPFIIWRGDDTAQQPSRKLSDITPGCTIIVPASYGGCDAFGWNPASTETVQDIAELAAMQAAARMRLRLGNNMGVPSTATEDHPDGQTLSQVLLGPASQLLQAFLPQENAEADHDITRNGEWRTALEQAAQKLLEPESLSPRSQQLASLCQEMAKAKLPPKLMDNGAANEADRQYYLVSSQRFPVKSLDGDNQLFDDDHSSPTGSHTPITLDRHTQDVAAFVSSFSTTLALPSTIRDALVMAAQHHDDGKADPRFQSMLFRGDTLQALRAQRKAGGLLAKSPAAVQNHTMAHTAEERSGYPMGARHELLSVRFAEALRRQGQDVSELCLHLIATHHGRCRPFAPVIHDPKPIQVNDFQVSLPSETGLERLDSGLPERFWNLVRLYGWWGLPYLETILRLADHRASQQEENA